MITRESNALGWARYRNRKKVQRLAIVGNPRWFALIDDAIDEKKDCGYVILAVCSTEPDGAPRSGAVASDNRYRYYDSVVAMLNAEEVDVLALDTRCAPLESDQGRQWVDQFVHRDLELIAPK